MNGGDGSWGAIGLGAWAFLIVVLIAASLWELALFLVDCIF